MNWKNQLNEYRQTYRGPPWERHLIDSDEWVSARGQYLHEAGAKFAIILYPEQSKDNEPIRPAELAIRREDGTIEYFPGTIYGTVVGPASNQRT